MTAKKVKRKNKPDLTVRNARSYNKRLVELEKSLGNLRMVAFGIYHLIEDYVFRGKVPFPKRRK